MKFITEINEDIEYLVEDTAQGKRVFIEGPFLSANVKNRNGRIYPGQVMESAVQKYSNDYITPQRSLGELGHPQNPAVNLDRVSHIIESLKHDGKNHWIGRARILESTPMGKIAGALVREGVKLGVSSRGLGSIVERNGSKIVQPDFFINTIDIVQDPSGSGCFVNGLMESVDYQMLEDGRIVEVVVDLAKKRVTEEKAMKAFGQYLIELANKK